MEDRISVILAILCVLQMLALVRYTFKINYYKQKLANRGIVDGVRSMPWYKLTLGE